MRGAAWALMLLFAFAIPWEFSLDLGEPFGNVARILGILVVIAAIPAILRAGRWRTPGPIQWLVLVLYLWFCLSCFWTTDQTATFEKMRAYAQEMAIVWLVWEFVESPRNLRALIRAYIAGSWVLAVLTLADFTSMQATAVDQIRFAAVGQDPNDVARFLDLGMPLAALLLNREERWEWRFLALGYIPLGLVAVVLTASRGGFLGAVLALAGCGLLLIRSHPKAILAGAFGWPAIAAVLWCAVPRETLGRLATAPAQLRGGDLNQRSEIWRAGYRAFARSPVFGSGAGSFVRAAGLHPLDTAHNSALSIAVGGGLCALCLAVAIVALVARSALRTHGALRLALLTVLLVWTVSSMVDTVEENRATWLLLGLIAAAERLAVEDRRTLEQCFSVEIAPFEDTQIASLSRPQEH